MCWRLKGFASLTLCWLLIWPFQLTTAASVEEVKIPLVVITSSRIPTAFPDVLRSVSIIEREEIENAPVHSIPEILEYVLGVDVITRGPKGSQADLSIRGSTFEQIAVLIDGIRVNDIQTGHHSLDIPLTFRDIERIEILRGHGSSLYGPNAFGGVINIITRRPEKRDIALGFIYGEHGMIQPNASLSFKKRGLGTSISVERSSHSGYRPGPDDSEILNIFLNSFLNFPFGSQKISFGFQEKDFGAQGFYGPFNSAEYTKTHFVNLSHEIKGRNLIVKPNLYFKRHYDSFILYQHRPDDYTNRHRTWFYGGELQASLFMGPFGDMAFGGEWREERIKSSGTREGRSRDFLGSHIDHRQAIYAEYNQSLLKERFFLNFGLRGDRHSDYGWGWCPTASSAYKLTSQTKLRTSVGKSFRVPTYIDLYYQDPKNWGNPDLRPEVAWSYELGLDYTGKKISSTITLFRREGRETISWVEKGEIYVCQNIGEVNVSGIELGLKGKIKTLPFSLHYTYMDSDTEGLEGLKEKYSYLRHKLCMGINLHLPLRSLLVIKAKYEDRLHSDAYFPIDTRISKEVKSFQFFLEATNLFNTHYEEIKGVPMPGRWIQGGIRLRLPL